MPNVSLCAQENEVHYLTNIPTPTGTLVASVWANQECTVRPTVNSTPNTVYLRIESDVEWPISWGGSGSTSVERDHNSLIFNYDHYEEGGEDVSEYDASVWNDWFSDIVEQKPSVGDVMELSHDGEPATVYDSFVMDFYLEDANE